MTNFSKGWKMGVEDAKNGVEPQFKEDDTEFSFGYYGGYHWELNKEEIV